jgi:hypothetical protein
MMFDVDERSSFLLEEFEEKQILNDISEALIDKMGSGLMIESPYKQFPYKPSQSSQ